MADKKTKTPTTTTTKHDSNAVHLNANWCQRIHSENVSQNEFNENWGFLKSESALLKEKELDNALNNPVHAGPINPNVMSEVQNTHTSDCLDDASLTKTLKSNIIQTLGGSIRTKGYSPNEKYTFPQTENQKLGWQKNSLEVFGTKDYARSSAKWTE